MKFSKPIVVGILAGSLVGIGSGVAIAATASGPPVTGPQYNQGSFIGLCVNPVTRASYWEVNTNFGTQASPNPHSQSNCANGYYQAVLPLDPALTPILNQTPPSCVNVSEPPVTVSPTPSGTPSVVTPEPSISCK
jgi:hypothetical protein